MPNKKLSYQKYIIPALTLLTAFSLGFGIRSLYTDKLASIDLQQVVAASDEVRSLRIKNDTEIKELSKWLDTAKAEIDAESKKAKRADLIREYREIAKSREEKIKKAYQEKLLEIDGKINALIEKVAADNGCKTVFNKTALVQGTIDITEEVLQQINAK